MSYEFRVFLEFTLVFLRWIPSVTSVTSVDTKAGGYSPSVLNTLILA
jgi:hypothetical protein